MVGLDWVGAYVDFLGVIACTQQLSLALYHSGQHKDNCLQLSIPVIDQITSHYFSGSNSRRSVIVVRWQETLNDFSPLNVCGY